MLSVLVVRDNGEVIQTLRIAWWCKDSHMNAVKRQSVGSTRHENYITCNGPRCLDRKWPAVVTWFFTRQILCLCELVHLEAIGSASAASPTLWITTVITVTHDVRRH